MTEPLTDDRLAEIRARIPHYDGPWTYSWNNGRNGAADSWLIGYPTTNPLAGLIASVPDYGACLADFIAHSRTDIPDLLAEVDRLRAEAAELRTQLATAERQAKELDTGLQSCKQRIHEAAMTKVWKNEDGKKFVFVEDLVGPLLGREGTS